MPVLRGVSASRSGARCLALLEFPPEPPLRGPDSYRDHPHLLHNSAAEILPTVMTLCTGLCHLAEVFRFGGPLVFTKSAGLCPVYAPHIT